MRDGPTRATTPDRPPDHARDSRHDDAARDHAHHDHAHEDHAHHDHAPHDHARAVRGHSHSGADDAGDGDHAGHAHGLGARRAQAASNRARLQLVLGLGVIILVGEVIGGILSGSLVLLTDAAHAFTDISAIAIALIAVTLAARPATLEKSYGFHRAEVIAAFINALALWLLSAYFIFEAFRRLQEPREVDAFVLIVVAAGTLVANLSMAWILHRGAGESVNVRSAYLHVLSDTLGSAAAVVAGLAIRYMGWAWADPVATLFVSGLILVWTWRLTRETLHILLEGTPERMDTGALRRDVLAVPGVLDVHDLHVWSITTGLDSMSAHVRVDDASRGPDLTRAIRGAIVQKYGLGHVTLEVEGPDAHCESCD